MEHDDADNDVDTDNDVIQVAGVTGYCHLALTHLQQLNHCWRLSVEHAIVLDCKDFYMSKVPLVSLPNCWPNQCLSISFHKFKIISAHYRLFGFKDIYKLLSDLIFCMTTN